MFLIVDTTITRIIKKLKNFVSQGIRLTWKIDFVNVAHVLTGLFDNE